MVKIVLRYGSAGLHKVGEVFGKEGWHRRGGWTFDERSALVTHETALTRLENPFLAVFTILDGQIEGGSTY
jgi:hypothetical protein